MHIRFASFFMIFVLFGCVSNPPTGTDLPDTESIKYTLPYTHAKVTVTLTLKSCDSPIKATAKVSIVPVAAPSSLEYERFEISGTALQSFARDRDVSITLHENRALKTVNASVTDKSPAIIGNVIKLATLFLAPSQPANLACTQEAEKILGHVATLKGKISALRKKQYDPSNPDDETTAKQINALATELARLKTGPLQVKLAKTIAIQPEIKAGYVTWKQQDFRKWIEDPDTDSPQRLLKDVMDFQMRYCIWLEEEKGECIDDLAKAGVEALECRTSDKKCKKPYVPDQVDCGDCPSTLVFREPVIGKFVLVAGSNNFMRPIDATLGAKTMPISQWGKVATLPMSVGFGGSKTVSVTLDAFGRRTAFGWKSGASGEAFTGGVMSVGGEYVTFRDLDDGASLKEIIDEATFLEAQQKLNKLEACREVIENGGYVCPEASK